jgi:hypothetical protein
MVLAGCMIVCATDREMAPATMFSQNTRGRFCRMAEAAVEAPPRVDGAIVRRVDHGLDDDCSEISVVASLSSGIDAGLVELQGTTRRSVDPMSEMYSSRWCVGDAGDSKSDPQV